MSTRFYAAILCAFLAICFAKESSAQSAPTLTFTPIVTSGLGEALDIVRPPADTQRLFIVEKTGRVKIFENGALRADSFLKISNLIVTSGEQGLLTLAFHPQYATNRFFWVVYNNTAGDLVLARYQTSATNPAVADHSSGVIVKVVPHPTHTNHNGSKLLFGQDGFLYWGTGDGGSGGDPSNNAQNKAVLLGKMLRFDVNLSPTPPYYSAPLSNPFIGQAGVDSLIFQFGLRNPYRWSFDRLTGDMWIADVGQNAWEEVNFSSALSAAGRDWGWRCREGAHPFNNNPPCAPTYTDPVFEYDHSTAGGLSITGGYVYRGSQYPALYGRYICVDYVRPNAWMVWPDGSGWASVRQAGIPTEIAGFGEDHRGELYAAGLNGRLYAVGATGGTPVGMEVSSVKAWRLVVSPLPVAPGGALRIESSEGLRTASLLDMQGRPVVSAALQNAPSEYSLSIPSLPSGIYLLQCTDAGGDVTRQTITVQ